MISMGYPAVPGLQLALIGYQRRRAMSQVTASDVLTFTTGAKAEKCNLVHNMSEIHYTKQPMKENHHGYAATRDQDDNNGTPT